MKDWKELQTEIGDWAGKNFDFHGPQLGVGEEIGELTHNILKSHQKIRDTDLDDMKDALADAMVFLLHLRYLVEHKQAPTNSGDELFVQLGRLHREVGALIQAPLIPEFHDRMQIMLEDTAQMFGFNLLEQVNDTWTNLVSKRDWRKFPKNGLTQ